MSEEPYPRRVTSRLMSTLGFVSEAIRTGNPGQILDGVERGVQRESVRRPSSYETLR